jgi:hypothetical protein
MPLLDFQTALGRLVRTPDDSDPFRSLSLGDAERACLDALPQSAGFRFTVAVQRSWCARRAVNAGLLALSILRDDTRRRLLDAWINSGGGTSSFFAVEADALLDYIAAQLPDPSPELTLCRFEQLTLRANHRAGSYKAPDRALFDPQCLIRRAHHAGVLLFHGKPDLILNSLLQRKPLPDVSLEVTALLVAPGLRPLCRIASAHEQELWTALTIPTVAAALFGAGYRRDVMQTLLHVGALEYA